MYKVIHIIHKSYTGTIINKIDLLTQSCYTVHTLTNRGNSMLGTKITLSFRNLINTSHVSCYLGPSSDGNRLVAEYAPIDNVKLEVLVTSVEEYINVDHIVIQQRFLCDAEVKCYSTDANVNSVVFEIDTEYSFIVSALDTYVI